MLSVIDLSEINNDETANTPELGNLQYHYKTLLDLQKTLSQQDSESGYSLILYKDELEKNISRPMDKKQALKILSSRIARYLQEDKDVIQFNNKDEIILYDYESFDIEKRKTFLDNFVLSAEKRLQYFKDIMDIKFNTMMSIYDCIGYLIRKWIFTDLEGERWLNKASNLLEEFDKQFEKLVTDDDKEESNLKEITPQNYRTNPQFNYYFGEVMNKIDILLERLRILSREEKLLE